MRWSPPTATRWRASRVESADGCPLAWAGIVARIKAAAEKIAASYRGVFRQARFEFAQLDVVQAIGHLFTVAGDKRHGGAFVQKHDGSFHLVGTNTDFLRDLRDDLLHGEKRHEGSKNQGREFATGGAPVG